MDLPKIVAKIRLTYHLNAIDICNAAYQLHMLDGEKADRINRDHLKNCLDCWERLGYSLTQELKDFKDEGAL